MALVEALERFLQQAREAVDEQLRRDDPLPPTPDMLAASLAELPVGREAGIAAGHAARASNYEVTSFPRRRRSGSPPNATDATADTSTTESEADAETAAPYGRPLDGDALIATGVFGLLQSRVPHDFHAVAEDLGAYLAGPPIGVWDYAILDARLTADDPIPVIDGWELVTPTTEDLRQLLPLPATATYQQDRPFTPQDYSGLTMLRRRRDDHPHLGPPLRFDVLYSLAIDRPAHPLWRPLLVLGLFENSVLQLWARYQIEPRRRIDKLFDDVVREVWIPDGVTEIERPMTGSYGDETDTQMLRRFLSELAPRMPADPAGKPSKKEDKAAARLRRCAEHFITAGSHAHGEGEVLSEQNADAVLHYVIALEGLLTSDESPGELTRKVSQRAAILAGKDDTQRVEIEQLVRDAYGARSRYAHGGDMPKQAIDLPKLRRVVRRCLLTRLIIGDPTPEGTLREVTDRALLSHEVLKRNIRQPFDEFTQRVQE